MARVAARIILSQAHAARDPGNAALSAAPDARRHRALRGAARDRAGRDRPPPGRGLRAGGGVVTDGFAPVPLMVNGFDGSGLAGLPAATRELIARREAALGGAYRLFYDEPVEFVRGAGVHLYDPDGVAYLDAYNNVPSVGHSHPAVTAAVVAAAGDAQHAHQVPDRRGRRVRRAAARHARDRPGPRDVHLHRERGERPGAAHRPVPHRRYRGDRDRQRVPRGDRRGGGALPQPGRQRPARRCTSGRCPRRSAGVGFRGRGGGRDRGSAAARGAAGGVPGRLDLLLRRGAARPGRGSSPGWPRWCARRAGSTSPTRCSPGSGGPGRRCGGTSGTPGWRRTS